MLYIYFSHHFYSVYPLFHLWDFPPPAFSFPFQKKSDKADIYI